MPPRTASKILAEWHELVRRPEEATDAEIDDAIAARITQAIADARASTQAALPFRTVICLEPRLAEPSDAVWKPAQD